MALPNGAAKGAGQRLQSGEAADWPFPDYELCGRIGVVLRHVEAGAIKTEIVVGDMGFFRQSLRSTTVSSDDSNGCLGFAKSIRDAGRRLADGMGERGL